MLFDQLPTGLLVVMMSISCAVKHTAIRRLLNTQWFHHAFLGNRWVTPFLLRCLLGGLSTYMIFDRFVGWPGSVYLALVDCSLYALTGTYFKYIRFFEMDSQCRFWVLVRADCYHTAAYASYIGLGLFYI